MENTPTGGRPHYSIDLLKVYLGPIALAFQDNVGSAVGAVVLYRKGDNEVRVN